MNKHSGFDCPVYGIIVPSGYKRVKDKDGLIHFVPPKGAKVPKEMKPYIKEKK